MKASIILCTYNRSKFLRDFFETLIKQTISTIDYELIIVNDGSSDDTESVVNSYQEVLPIKFINLKRNVGKDQAVFIGVAEASTDYLLFTDDDCLVNSSWIESMVRELNSSAIVAGRVTTPEKPYLTLCRNISEFHEFMGKKPVDSIHFLAGANMGLRREVLEAIGKIPETITSFDTSIAFHALQKGYSIRYSPIPTVLHQPDYKSIRSLWNYEIKRANVTIQLRYQFRSILRTPFYLQRSWLLLFLSPLIALGRTSQVFTKAPIYHWFHTFPIVLALKFAWCWGSFKGLKRIGR